MNNTEDNKPGSLGRFVRPVCEIQSENGAALLLDTVWPQNGKSPAYRQMKVTEIVRDLVNCPECFDLFLAAHTFRLRECLKKAHDLWKSSGEPDLGECPVRQDIDGRDYLMFAYFKLCEACWPNDPSSPATPEAGARREGGVQ